MKLDKIYEVFTAKVSEYIAEGYMIHPASMSGSQGEIGKVDLVKGKDLIRVWLSKEWRYFRDGDDWSRYKLVLRVGSWKKPVRYIGCDDTVWMSDLLTLEEITYYQVGPRSDWYLDDLEQAKACQRVSFSRSRYVDNRPTPIKNELSKDIARKYMMRTKGYKRVSRDMLSVRKYLNNDKVTYFIHYGDRAYTLK